MKRARNSAGAPRCYHQYMAVSRRGFLDAGLGAAVALVAGRVVRGQGLEQFGTPEPPCTDDPRLTPAVPIDRSFRAGAPRRSRLADPGTPGVPFVLSGVVSGVTCGRIAGARVDVWQADASGAFDASGFRLRGHQLTDANGRFTFTTVEPGPEPGRAKRLGLRVQVAGKFDLPTEVFFPDDPRASGDPRFRKELLLKLQRATSGRAASFDVVLPL